MATAPASMAEVATVASMPAPEKLAAATMPAKKKLWVLLGLAGLATGPSGLLRPAACSKQTPAMSANYVCGKVRRFAGVCRPAHLHVDKELVVEK